jgi:protein-disulfide isomerase
MSTSDDGNDIPGGRLPDGDLPDGGLPDGGLPDGGLPDGPGPVPGRTRLRRLIGLAAGAAVVVVLAAVALLDGGGGGGAGSGTRATQGRDGAAAPPRGPSSPTSVPTITGPKPPRVETAVMLGRTTAPVTIVEFGDFQCPNCGRFARDIKPALVKKYVDTGVVRVAWRDFPTFGKQSVAAAVGGRAAGRQGGFWQFHDTLYARRLPARSGRLTRSYLRDVARDADLDLGRYDADVRDDKLRELVDADFTFGQDLGVPGTPAFLINGEAFFGAQPLAAFEKAIERARAGG